jgi:hypothetical protein
MTERATRRTETEYRVVDANGRHTSSWFLLEHAREAMHNYDTKHWPENGPHRIQVRTTTIKSTGWKDVADA